MATAELKNVSITDAGIIPGTMLADTRIERSIGDRDAKSECVPLDGTLSSAHSTLTDAVVSGE